MCAYTSLYIYIYIHIACGTLACICLTLIAATLGTSADDGGPSGGACKYARNTKKPVYQYVCIPVYIFIHSANCTLARICLTLIALCLLSGTTADAGGPADETCKYARNIKMRVYTYVCVHSARCTLAGICLTLIASSLLSATTNAGGPAGGACKYARNNKMHVYKYVRVYQSAPCTLARICLTLIASCLLSGTTAGDRGPAAGACNYARNTCLSTSMCGYTSYIYIHSARCTLARMRMRVYVHLYPAF